MNGQFDDDVTIHHLNNIHHKPHWPQVIHMRNYYRSKSWRVELVHIASHLNKISLALKIQF